MCIVSTIVMRSTIQSSCRLNHIKFGKGDKLSPRFMGPFEIVERKGPVAYRLALFDSLRRVTSRSGALSELIL
jgi:hypothetical protein